MDLAERGILEARMKTEGPKVFETWEQLLNYCGTFYENDSPLVKWIPEGILKHLFMEGHDFNRDLTLMGYGQEWNDNSSKKYCIYNHSALLEIINETRPENTFPCEQLEITPFLKKLPFLQRMFVLGEEFFCLELHDHFHIIGLHQEYYSGIQK